MAQRKNKQNGTGDEQVSALDKIARLLGTLVVKDLTQRSEQAILLRSVGFTNSEISSILGISENHVSVALYQSGKKKTKKR